MRENIQKCATCIKEALIMFIVRNKTSQPHLPKGHFWKSFRSLVKLLLQGPFLACTSSNIGGSLYRSTYILIISNYYYF